MSALTKATINTGPCYEYSYVKSNKFTVTALGIMALGQARKCLGFLSKVGVFHKNRCYLT